MVYEIASSNAFILVRHSMLASTLAVRALIDPYIEEISEVALESLGLNILVKVEEVYNSDLKINSYGRDKSIQILRALIAY